MTEDERRRKEYFESMTQAYRNVFVRARDGDIVLADLLASLGFFRTDIDTERDAERRNVAQEILSKIGCFGTGEERSHEVVSELTRALSKIPITKKEEKKDDR